MYCRLLWTCLAAILLFIGLIFSSVNQLVCTSLFISVLIIVTLIVSGGDVVEMHDSYVSFYRYFAIFVKRNQFLLQITDIKSIFSISKLGGFVTKVVIECEETGRSSTVTIDQSFRPLSYTVGYYTVLDNLLWYV